MTTNWLWSDDYHCSLHNIERNVCYNVVLAKAWFEICEGGEFTFSVDDVLQLSLTFSVIQGAQSLNLTGVSFRPENNEWYRIKFFVTEPFHRFRQFIWFSIVSSKDSTSETRGQIKLATEPLAEARRRQISATRYNSTFKLSIITADNRSYGERHGAADAFLGQPSISIDTKNWTFGGSV